MRGNTPVGRRLTDREAGIPDKKRTKRRAKSMMPSDEELRKWMRTKGSKGSWTKNMEKNLRDFSQ